LTESGIDRAERNRDHGHVLSPVSKKKEEERKEERGLYASGKKKEARGLTKDGKGKG